MILDETKVKELIENGVSDYILGCREYSDLLNMHITGRKIKEYTEKFTNHENEKQKELRERLIVSNKSLFSFSLQPINKVFSAKGGLVNYNVNEGRIDTIKEYVSNIADGLSIKEYLNQIARHYYIVDPNAFTFIDIDINGNLETKIVNVSDVITYERNGNNIEYIIFNPYMSDDEDDDKEYYRVLDDTTDRIFIKDGDSVYLQEDTILDNYFGYVPAYILGDKYCVNTGMFLSFIDEVLEDANEHLRDVSVNIVHKLSHGYAKYWQLPEECTTCSGTGEIEKTVDEEIRQYVCYSCGGHGLKTHNNASDMMIVGIPKEGEPNVLPNVGGYINPSIEVWRQYKEDIKDLRDRIYQTLWGATFSIDAKNETATGKVINAQPQAERTVLISRTFSKIHEFILDCYGKIALDSKEYKSQVSYGTRYLIENPEQILNTLQGAKEKGLPISIQQHLTDVYFQSEFANNQIEYQKKVKLSQVEPFPFMTAAEVKELGVIGNELIQKIYFHQWETTLTEAKILLMDIIELKADLKTYISNLNTKIEDGTVQQNAD